MPYGFSVRARAYATPQIPTSPEHPKYGLMPKWEFSLTFFVVGKKTCARLSVASLLLLATSIDVLPPILPLQFIQPHTLTIQIA